MRKTIVALIVGYILFGAAIGSYLFFLTDTTIPEQYRGTAADPATFMDERELTLSQDYATVRNLLFFLSTPYEWVLLFLLLIVGLSRKIKVWSEATTRFRSLQILVYFFWFSLLTSILSFPLKWYGYSASKKYGINVQPFSNWMKDYMIDYWINFLLTGLIVIVLYTLIQRSQKRWWFYAWLLSIPFTLFLTFIQPVVIAPLYNDFYPLKDKELEAKILALADEAGIPAEHVFEVNMSEKTNAMNAYVTGIAGNSRIVLWDTTIEKLSDDEVLFIMAHEMGHYVKKHILFGTVGYIFVTLVGLFLIHKMMNTIVTRWGHALHIKNMQEISSIPLFFLLLSLLSFIFLPINNTVSRMHELESDKYAIELTGDNTAAVMTFQKLSKTNLSEVNPPILVKIFRYTHPPMLDRLHFLESYGQPVIEDN
ncbi:M48 family metallopeptidase [Bacillus salitolerans]|uniref:M48 family metallopeptidase n=1 Tax=Bacillus salitolerans TaxID=1437434 RepID=A0ABW4LYD8_9BACI